VKKLKNAFRSTNVKRRPIVNGEDGTGSTDHSRGPISYLDFESKIRHFALIVQVIDKSHVYEATEESMSIEGLKQHLENLIRSHRAVHATKMALKTAANRRNEVIYGDVKSTILQVKQYLIGAFGTGSINYKKVLKIKVSNL